MLADSFTKALSVNHLQRHQSLLRMTINEELLEELVKSGDYKTRRATQRAYQIKDNNKMR